MKATPARNIVLIGPMGAGKSSLAKAIARKTGCLRLDTDHEIESQIGRPIARIFAEEGEEFFRDAETEMLKNCRKRNGYVISTGGGIVIRPGNRDLLQELGFVVWLHAPEEVLFERISKSNNRPLLQTADPLLTLRQVIKGRLPLYREVSDLAIDTSLLTRQKIINTLLISAGWTGALK